MTKVTQIAKNVIKSVEEKLKILSKIKGDKIEQANVDIDDVKEFARIKAERDIALANLKKIGDEYEAARQKIISQLPGFETDVVDIVIAGVRIHKFPRNTAAGKLDEEKVLELARKKKILGKVAPFVRKINSKALIEAIAEEKVTYDEYLECTKQNIVPVVEIELVQELDITPNMKVAE